MNIFVTYRSPEKCAKVLDNKRVIKMILESAQMLSTAITKHGGIGFYKPTHKNHPCTIWAGATKSNYQWLRDHFVALCQEYQYRYNKTHKCYQFLSDIDSSINIIPNGPLTPFVNATTFKNIQNVYFAYRLALLSKWGRDIRSPQWSGRKKPNWRF